MDVPPARRAAIRRRLLAWYDAGHRSLPWRFPQCGADPYRVWLSEVMLQQTQVARVLPYYLRFVERWPTLGALARARDEDVLAAWSGLGYYARCRNLLAAARQALRRHGGLPSSVRELRALPGFGAYTAGAVASIAFGARAAAVDGNAARVLSRLFLVPGDPGARETRQQLWRLAEDLVPGGEAGGRSPSRPGDFNQALIELGATVCRRASPQCRRCPLLAACQARREGRERELPRPRRRPARRRVEMACAVAVRGGDVLVARRRAGLLAGLWGLPGDVVRRGEAPARAVLRAFRSLGVAGRVGIELAAVERTLTHRDLTLRAFRCSAPAALAAGADARWIPRSRVGRLGMATAMLRLAEAAGVAPRPAPSRRRQARRAAKSSARPESP